VINPINTRTTSKASNIYLVDSENYWVAEHNSLLTTGSLTLTTTEPAWIQKFSIY